MDPTPPAATGTPPRPGNRLVGWLLVGAVFLGFGALGVGGIYYFFDMRAEEEFLSTKGERAVAHVISSYKPPGRGTGVQADIMFATVDGELAHESLAGCDSSLTVETEYLTVFYDPADPSFVRPASCFGMTPLAWIALFGGIAILAFDVFLIQRFIRGPITPEPSLASGG